LEFGRGRLTSSSDRIKVIEVIDEAIASGARQFKACEVVGISERTLQRWRKDGAETRDKRPEAVRPVPANKLTESEKTKIIKTMNQEKYQNLPPSQVVPRLADEGTYIASESSFYRVLREHKQNNHRGKSKAPVKRYVTTHSATGPNQVWMWDITWLPGPVKGIYYYLYLIIDLFSRKIIGWEIWEYESSEKASELVRKACLSEQLSPLLQPLVLHSDNGSPMKGSSLLTTLYELGIVPSNSRPRVSNDNAFIESFFKTVKYMPMFPYNGFNTISDARTWVLQFSNYYNREHRHSSLKFITPNERHNGLSKVIMDNRKAVYEAAKLKNPNRWSGSIRNWDLNDTVYLNPEKDDKSIAKIS